MDDDRLAALLAPVLAAHGLELEALDVVPAGRRRLLRVVVDGDGPAGRGPLLDDIAAASSAVSAALDASDADGRSPYTLEVSSRGVDRPLTEPRHWRRNTGRLVRVRLADGGEVTGRIVRAGDDAVVLDVDGGPRELGWAEVRDGRVQVELRSNGDSAPADPAMPEEED